MEQPKFSIIIYTEHEPESLVVTLSAINALNYPRQNIEVIVLDPEDDRRRSEAASRFGASYLLPQKKTRAGAWNEALRHARGEIAVFTDDDCRPVSGWLEEYSPVFCSELVCAGGPDKVPARSRRFLKYLDYVLTSYMGSAGLRTSGRRKKAYYPRHWNMAIDRSVALQLGGFDETIPDALELELVSRIRDAGHSVGFVRGAVVWHQRDTDLYRYLQRNLILSASRARLSVRRFIYALPAAALLICAALAVAAPYSRAAEDVLKIGISAYAAVLAGSGIHAALTLRDAAAPAAVPAMIFTQHLTHALGYIAAGATHE